MARLHEYQGKALLAEHGIPIPRGRVIRLGDDVNAAIDAVGPNAVMKVQAWVTGRKDKGGVRFVHDAASARDAADDLLNMRFGHFPVQDVLVEELLDIERELFVSLTIDDAARAPLLLLDCAGGTGIEDRADSVARLPVSVSHGVCTDTLRTVLGDAGIADSLHSSLVDAIEAIVETAKSIEARSLEVNPLVVLSDGSVMAADCRVTIDDYAVFRHPELGIKIARELDHPPTVLERIAYDVEQADHRGTFYFAQLPTDGHDSTKGLVGFHGAGGGGSMMSMDAISNEGFTLANFCDTSGNPSAAKVYRAARIILSQRGLCAYFGSGSGVASQEQFHSAYGLAKAFNEVQLSIPAVIRLGGNAEDRAVDILEDACSALGTSVEGYRKDDTPAFCAERLTALVEAGGDASPNDGSRNVPKWVGHDAEAFPIDGGHVWIDVDRCDAQLTASLADWSSGLLKDDGAGKPTLAVDNEAAAKADSEFIACEIECLRAGTPVVFVDLPVPGLDEPGSSEPGG